MRRVAWVVSIAASSLVGCAGLTETTDPEPASMEERTSEMENVKTLWNASVQAEDGGEELIGQVVIEGGVLAIASLANDSMGDYLQGIVDDLNGMPVLVEKAPPADDSQRHGVGARSFERSSPDFVEALVRKLEKNYSLTLTPAQ